MVSSLWWPPVHLLLRCKFLVSS